MATVSSSPDQAADLMQNLSLDSETKTATAQDYANKGLYGDNGSVMYHQGYTYPQYGMYPSPGLTSVAADQVSLSVETNTGNPSAVLSDPGVSGNNGSKPLRPSYHYPYLDPNGSQRREGSSTMIPSPGYHDPRYSFDGTHSPLPLLDSSIYTGGQSKHAANAAFTSPTSHNNNFPSGRNHYQSHRTNLHPTRPTSGLGEPFDYMSQMYPSNAMYGHYGNTFRAASAFGSYGYGSWMNGRGWYAVDNKNKPRGRGNGAYGFGKDSVDGLNELNKGPRAKGFKNQEGFDSITQAVKGQNFPSSESGTGDNLSSIPDKDKYSGEDFPESYSDAMFFVIKSYSEDDVHKSVKYNMWTSTPNGNKKLDAAYRNAKEKTGDCPVFLLFSVNASGQFVGLAEMVGPVDFEKTVEYWQQDKWTGCFPLKWHIIKDVPNSSLRHIILENNENKPVTNSRDTQEVNFDQGIQIIKIFKSHSSKRCILDDFEFYESREKIMQQKKSKQHQLQKQVLDRKPSDVVIDDKDVTTGKDGAQKSLDEALKSKLVDAASGEAQEETNGEVKKLDEDGLAATVEDTGKVSTPVVLSGKKGSSNGVASAC
ncbi:hypothetical protein LWI29_014852 [Acer saccharum]|uniref:YTH domain-containing family protein n=1 Tax=Acer saccharum TaxID=4024 RepID=A0AA39SWQ5_ACESA|nr:hypothetical protein LWI29_014852 [Acer saccharum]